MAAWPLTLHKTINLIDSIKLGLKFTAELVPIAEFDKCAQSRFAVSPPVAEPIATPAGGMKILLDDRGQSARDG